MPVKTEINDPPLCEKRVHLGNINLCCGSGAGAIQRVPYGTA